MEPTGISFFFVASLLFFSLDEFALSSASLDNYEAAGLVSSPEVSAAFSLFF